jgi:hypothetical protein
MSVLAVANPKVSYADYRAGWSVTVPFDSA